MSLSNLSFIEGKNTLEWRSKGGAAIALPKQWKGSENTQGALRMSFQYFFDGLKRTFPARA
jgi:hypothetical protein